MKRQPKPKTLDLREWRTRSAVQLALAMAWAALEPLDRDKYMRQARIAIEAMRDAQGGRI